MAKNTSVFWFCSKSSNTKHLQQDWTLANLIWTLQPQFSGAFVRFRKATAGFAMSVRMEQLGSHYTDFHEIWYLKIFRRSGERTQVSLKSDKKNAYFTADLRTFMTMPCSVLLRMRNIKIKSCRENQNTHFVFNNFFSKIVPVYEIMWKNMTRSYKPQITI